jgi:type VI secretion system secreted protein VgrG
MPLNLSFTFPNSPEATAVVAAGFKVQRYELHEAISTLFELTIEVLSSDPAIDMAAVVGQHVAVHFEDEPFLKELRGVVRHVAQRTAVPTGDSKYEWIIVPALWFTTQRRDHRIFQDLTAAEILALVLADPAYGGRILQAAGLLGDEQPTREYCVQYGETDHDFLFRLLAEDGTAAFFDHANASAFTLTSSTREAADLIGAPVPFSDPGNLNPIVVANPGAPHVSAVKFSAGVATSAATIRSWDFTRPALVLEESSSLKPELALPNEGRLEAYTFEPGAIERSTSDKERSTKRLQALRALSRTLECETSFALPPGARLTLADHPRADLNVDLLVVEAHTVAVFGQAARHVLTCIELRRIYLPPSWPKPRIHGTQTAIVVGAPGQEIDVDKFGRVEVEFHWDRRALHTGGTSRRVRVSQGWAGAGFGFVMLPRVNEEVIVTYLDGDPDEPIIVGRVHNAVVASPLQLPAEKTVSVWRSKSSPGGDGFNEIRMDDQAGAERLWMHAERDFKLEIGRNAQMSVTQDQTVTVGRNVTTNVVGDQTTDVVGMMATTATAGMAFATSGAFNMSAHGDLTMVAGGDRTDHAVGKESHHATSIKLTADDEIRLEAPTIMLTASAMMVLECGGSKIELYPGSMRITSGGPIEVNGSVVKLNC